MNNTKTILSEEHLTIEGKLRATTRRERVKINSHFFRTESPEMAYVVGFILADGCVTYKPQRSTWNISIAQKKSSKYILEDILKAMDSSNNVKSIKRRSGFAGEDLARIDIHNKEIVCDAMALGLIPRKSKIARLPDITQYKKDLIRGYFDGDGSAWIYNQTKKGLKGLRTTFASGSRLLLEDVGALLKDELFLIPKIYLYSDKRNFRLQYGMRESLCLYDWMYSDNDTLYLKEKKNVFEDIIDIKGIRHIFKAKCKICNDVFVRTRRERNVCNHCHIVRRRKKKTLTLPQDMV